MPVLAKSMLPSGTYDEKVRLREDMEKQIAVGNQQKEKELKDLYNTLAKENDEAFIREMFLMSKPERDQKMKANLEAWKAADTGSFDEFWKNMKKDVLSKQEH